MKIAYFNILLQYLLGDINKIARVNKLKKAAESAYKSGDYERAIAYFQNTYRFFGC
jgi:hypothetical protein